MVTYSVITVQELSSLNEKVKKEKVHVSGLFLWHKKELIYQILPVFTLKQKACRILLGLTKK